MYVLSDSNVRVQPTYLWGLVEELEDARVGMVTSVFAGTGERTLGAALENLQLCASTTPGMVSLDAVSRRPLTVGKSMAVRRRDLARLGGFRAVGDVLAVRVLRGGWMAWRYLPLEVVRSYVVLLCWARACVSRRIDWRGHGFTLRRGTVIVPVTEAPEQSPDRARLAA